MAGGKEDQAWALTKALEKLGARGAVETKKIDHPENPAKSMLLK